MKLVSFGPEGMERPGVLDGEHIVDLLMADPSLPCDTRGILDAGLIDRVADVAGNAGHATHVEATSARLGPPVTNPSKIICLGRNYRAHATEQNREAPSYPMLFSKGPNVLCGDRDEVPHPRGVGQLDYEVELAFVIGRRGVHIAVADAWQYVAGYGVFIDLSARDIQRAEKQWFRGKSFDRGGPFGPFLLTADEMDEPHNLAIELDVNGETRQSSNTGEVTFRIDYLIHYISQTMTLEPGDIVATGTPSGVGAFRDPPVFLQPGDSIRARVESLGTLHCTIGPTQ